MDHSDPATALGAVVHCRLVQTLTLNIILQNTTPLHRCIQADAHDAATEEEEDENVVDKANNYFSCACSTNLMKKHYYHTQCYIDFLTSSYKQFH